MRTLPIPPHVRQQIALEERTTDAAVVRLLKTGGTGMRPSLALRLREALERRGLAHCIAAETEAAR